MRFKYFHLSLVVFLVALLLGTLFVVVRLVSKDKEVPVEETAEVVEEVVAPITNQEVIGSSVEGRDITAYTYGNGETKLLFVGGIHGGYEWNSTVLAYYFMEYFAENPAAVPANVTISIIPTLNPDGTFAVVGTSSAFDFADVPTGAGLDGDGRFNANGVDLNRNFACKWQDSSTWRGQVVSAGTAAFSEPEAVALRDYVIKYQPASVVFWHSQANAVYASECENGILPATLDIMNVYAQAGGYQAVDSFDAYPITGDAEGYLASIGIPAITVELSTHETTDWQKNLAAMKALLSHYSTN